MRPAWLTTVSALLAGAAHAAPLTFAAAQKIADETAPSLQAKGADITAARSAVIAAGRLPDPKLGFAVEGFPVSGPYAGRPHRDDFSDLRFSVSQELPNVAKRRAARERAGAEIDVAEASKVVEARNVQVNTALAWIDLYYSVRRLKALDDIDHALAPLRKAGRAELASGVSRPAQTLEAEQLTAALGDRRAELTAEVGKARAELVRWTGDADVEVAGDPPDFRIDSAALRAGLDRIPTLAAYDAMSAQADADLSAAKADKRPDWGVELGYQRRDPTFGDMVMAGVTVSLPIFPGTRQDPIIASRA